jgi:hypothetical protein
LRAGKSGARIAPEPIDTRKKKESRAIIDRTLSVMQCPTLFAFSRKRYWLKAAVDPDARLQIWDRVELIPIPGN